LKRIADFRRRTNYVSVPHVYNLDTLSPTKCVILLKINVSYISEKPGRQIVTLCIPEKKFVD